MAAVALEDMRTVRLSLVPNEAGPCTAEDVVRLRATLGEQKCALMLELDEETEEENEDEDEDPPN